MKKTIVMILMSTLSLSMWAGKPALLYRLNVAKNQQWVDSVYNSMSQRERVAQLFIPMVDPTGGASSRLL